MNAENPNLPFEQPQLTENLINRLYENDIIEADMSWANIIDGIRLYKKEILYRLENHEKNNSYINICINFDIV